MPPRTRHVSKVIKDAENAKDSEEEGEAASSGDLANMALSGDLGTKDHSDAAFSGDGEIREKSEKRTKVIKDNRISGAEDPKKKEQDEGVCSSQDTVRQVKRQEAFQAKRSKEIEPASPRSEDGLQTGAVEKEEGVVSTQFPRDQRSKFIADGGRTIKEVETQNPRAHRTMPIAEGAVEDQIQGEFDNSEADRVQC